MPNGKKVAERLKAGEGGGMPWLAIFDSEGQRLITSIAPATKGNRGGNIGAPVQPHEIDWFMTMIDRGKKALTADDMAAIRKEHALFVQPILEARRRR